MLHRQGSQFYDALHHISKCHLKVRRLPASDFFSEVKPQSPMVEGLVLDDDDDFRE